MKWVWRATAGLFDGMVAPAYGAPGYHARRRTWPPSPEDRSALAGKHMVVTGANAGIGRAVAHALALQGATVHLVSRSEERGNQARRDLAAATGNEALHVHRADMSRLDDVRALAEQLAAQPHIDAIVHNAGALVHTLERTADDLELTFATHVAGPFLLTDALLPRLRRAETPRVIWVTSGGMYTQKLELQGLFEGREPFDGVLAYAQAKRAQVELAHLWAAALAADGIGVATAHPGWADTTGVERALPGFYKATRWFLRSPEQGADTIAWLASSDAGSSARGELFFDRMPRRQHLPLRRTQTAPQDLVALWQALRRRCGTTQVPAARVSGDGWTLDSAGAEPPSP